MTAVDCFGKKPQDILAMKNNFLESYRLEIIVFLCGAIVMVMELVGSRVVAPYFGNSLIVWTSLIGIVLGSLSAGYYFGGKIADKSPKMATLSRLLFVAGILTGLTAFFKEPVLIQISQSLGSELRSASFLAILILFGPASFILGIVSPYAAKLRVVSLENSGKVMGNLYALSTLGSISGTFLAGFYLIPGFGNTVILYCLAVALMLTSVLSIGGLKKNHLGAILLILSFAFINQGLGLFKIKVMDDVDSLYSRILVKMVQVEGDELVTMGTENSDAQSGVLLSKPNDLFFGYTRAYAMFESIDSRVEKTLMIGGGGYTFPRYFLLHHPEAKMDVVEIDPKMTELAKKYFFLTDDPRMKIYHQDARSFISKSTDRYDVIFLDAFNSLSPPPHLTTKEFMTDLKNNLKDNGFLMINLISAIEGSNSKFLLAEKETLSRVFTKLEVYMLEKRPLNMIQNLMVVAYNDTSSQGGLDFPKVIFEGRAGSLLTDDWAPVEYLTKGYYSL